MTGEQNYDAGVVLNRVSVRSLQDDFSQLYALLVLLYVSNFYSNGTLMENSSSVEGEIWSCKQCAEIPLASRIVVDEKAGKYETFLSCLDHKLHITSEVCGRYDVYRRLSPC